MKHWIAQAAVAFGLLGAGCTSPARPMAPPAVTYYPTPTAIPAVPPTPTSLVYDGRWQIKAPGIEYALIEATQDGRREWILVARVQPRRARMRVAYAPDAPKTVREWHLTSQADLVVNAGFFDQQNRTTGLVVADGQVFGRSYVGFGGMFALRSGAPSLQWLRDEPYRPDASITQAVQGFPMLVVDGAVVEGIPESDRRHRRTFVALDRSGRVLLGVTQLAQWRLSDLAIYLATSDLDVWRALNLDGGGSSGLWLSQPHTSISMNSLDPVPTVILVWAG
ncbi:MAG: phosphodiester glycosidase family protein [Anaerolineae bacterium]|nr:phosphodiester glycosidase family protein [Thermoflexales bacterium]MDW8394726.1 phosphodiester glycosidase family protein [Anaerolineae bacterium]